MVTSDPWLTLGRTREAALVLLRDSTREISVAVDPNSDALMGFVIVLMRGAFVGYIQTVAVAAEYRGRGIGSMLIAHAESRIFSDSPNVFLCVSSFNHSARALYERLGYEEVGELRDYVVRGYSEFLLRKTRGPLNEYRG
ncbi:MAG: GNAT family N-acetyltransferase [Anaerolineae bacterium]|nr:GNAT family N-acetyltransferase [Gemmatimonadaceae bacterium]